MSVCVCVCVCGGGGGGFFFGANPVGVHVASFLNQWMEFDPACIDTLLGGVTS